MNLRRILDEHEAQKQKRALEHSAVAMTESEKAENERQRRRLNGERIEAHLKSQVLPVLAEAEQQLSVAGHKFFVQEISEHDPKFPDSRKFVLCLRFESGMPPMEEAYLQFEGDLDSATIRPHQRIKCRPIGEHALTLLEVTQEYIGGRVESFVKAVLAAID